MRTVLVCGIGVHVGDEATSGEQAGIQSPEGSTVALGEATVDRAILFL